MNATRWLNADRLLQIISILVALGLGGAISKGLDEAFGLSTFLLISIGLIVTGAVLWASQWLPMRQQEPVEGISVPFRPPIRTQLNWLIQNGTNIRKGIPKFAGASQDQVVAHTIEHGGHSFKQAFAWQEQVWQALIQDAQDLTYMFSHTNEVPELTYASLGAHMDARLAELREIMKMLPPGT